MDCWISWRTFWCNYYLSVISLYALPSWFGYINASQFNVIRKLLVKVHRWGQLNIHTMLMNCLKCETSSYLKSCIIQIVVFIICYHKTAKFITVRETGAVLTNLLFISLNRLVHYNSYTIFILFDNHHCRLQLW